MTWCAVYLEDYVPDTALRIINIKRIGWRCYSLEKRSKKRYRRKQRERIGKAEPSSREKPAFRFLKAS